MSVCKQRCCHRATLFLSRNIPRYARPACQRRIICKTGMAQRRNKAFCGLRTASPTNTSFGNISGKMWEISLVLLHGNIAQGCYLLYGLFHQLRTLIVFLFCKFLCQLVASKCIHSRKTKHVYKYANLLLLLVINDPGLNLIQIKNKNK